MGMYQEVRIPTLTRGAATCWGYMAHHNWGGSSSKGPGSFVISVVPLFEPRCHICMGALKLPEKAEQSPQSHDESCPLTSIFTCTDEGPKAQRREESVPKLTRAETGWEPTSLAFRLDD